MAVLKHTNLFKKLWIIGPFPRLKGRGRIEASDFPFQKHPWYSFPRLKGRGRIEASQDGRPQSSGLPFPRLKGRGRIEAGNRLASAPLAR